MLRLNASFLRATAHKFKSILYRIYTYWNSILRLNASFQRATAHKFKSISHRIFKRPPSTQLCTYRNDPITLLIANLKIKPIRVFFMYILLFLGIKILFNLLDSTLISDTLLRDFYSDVGVFLPFKAFYLAIKSIVGVFNVAISIPQSNQITTSVSIPYFRDYIDIFIMIIGALNTTLIHYQWQNLSNIPSTLWKNQVITGAITPEQYENLVKDGNSWFNKKIWNIMSFIIAASVVILGILCFAKYGMYSSLNPGLSIGEAPWGTLAYRGWWSNPINGWFPLIYNIIIYIFIAYYWALQNIVGYGMIRFYLKADNYAKQNVQTLMSPQPGHPDGFHGLQMIKNVMAQVSLSLLMSNIMLLMVYLFLPKGAVPVSLLIIFSVGFAVAVFSFLIFPLLSMRQRLIKNRDLLLQNSYQKIKEYDELINNSDPRLRDQPAQLSNLLWRQHYWSYREMVREIPTHFVSIRRTLVVFLANIFTFFLLTVQIIALNRS